MFLTSAYRKPDQYIIDAQKNGQVHNNLGIKYLEEGVYYAAIQEFKLAISLNPDTQASGVYYYNLGSTYLKIGYPDLAQAAFEMALECYSMDFRYYKSLAQCFQQRGLADFKLKQYSADKNPLSKIFVGLLYAQKGEVRRAIIILDEFVMSEPDLIITKAVKQEIKELIKSIN
jgi:tetratricopeptide (TPR) repeat protein